MLLLVHFQNLSKPIISQSTNNPNLVIVYKMADGSSPDPFSPHPKRKRTYVVWPCINCSKLELIMLNNSSKILSKIQCSPPYRLCFSNVCNVSSVHESVSRYFDCQLEIIFFVTKCLDCFIREY